MSYSQHERGKYIRLKMHEFILRALGEGKINAEEAGHSYDLISEIETAGTTHSQELAKNDFYLRAVAEWVKARKIQRKRIAKSKTI